MLVLALVFGGLATLGSLAWMERSAFGLGRAGWPVSFVTWATGDEVLSGNRVHGWPAAADILLWSLLGLMVLSLLAAVSAPRGVRGWKRILAGRCHACGYDLTGNVSGVCPECGSAILSRDAAHPPPWRKPFLLFLTSLGALILLDWTMDAGRLVSSCPDCGAVSESLGLWWGATGGPFATCVQEGPVSQFIQESQQFTCPHRWERCLSQSGGLVVRTPMAWIGWRRLALVTRLQDNHPRVAEYLRERAAADATFSARFLQLIRFPRRTRVSRDLWTEMTGDLRRRETDR
jgi:predicted RNA-binding Zn-ribbon protein involved in translation (DUF1610 family)